MKSIHLNYCWICEKRFTDAENPGLLNREEHHVIPRAYGGIDGPTVSLCDTHHTAAHKVASLLEAGKPYHLFTKNLNQTQISKLLYLATVIVNAKNKVANDPNKYSLVIIKLDKDTSDKVNKLQKIYKGSREKLVRLSINSLYNKHFMS